MCIRVIFFFFFKQKTAYEISACLVGSEMCIRDRNDEPLRPTTGIQSQLPVLYEEYRFRQPADVEDYLALLALTGDYFNQIIRFEQQKAQAGLFMSDYACNTLISQCSAFTADPDQHYLIQTFDHKIDAMSELMEEQKTCLLYTSDAADE